MKKARKKVPYTKASKRNVMRDVRTDAGRRAKARSADKAAIEKLRAVLGHPADKKGKPLAGHLVKTLAAGRLASSVGQNVEYDFRAAVEMFLGGLKYLPGFSVSVDFLWKTLIGTLEKADAQFMREVVNDYQTVFRWYVAGYVHRIKGEYDRLPGAIVAVEVWTTKKKQRRLVAVQRDGNRREFQQKDWPESPTLLRAGTEFQPALAASDVDKIRRIGAKRFLREIVSKKRKLTPPASGPLHEDMLVNVAMPTEAELSAIQRDIKGYFSLINKASRS